VNETLKIILLASAVLAGLFGLWALWTRWKGRRQQPPQQQPQQPANPAAGAQPQQQQQSQPRDWKFWTLFTISIIGFIVAGAMVKQIQTGAIAVVSVTTSNAALVMGITLTIVALCWFNAIGGWPARRIWGTITAIFAGILLMIASWNLFLGGWYKQINAPEEKGGGLVPFLDKHHVAVIVVASVIIMIMLWKWKGIRKFAAIICIVGLVGWFGVKALNSVTTAIIVGSNSPENVETITATPNGVKRFDVKTTKFIKVDFPPGYNWEMLFFGENGVGYYRPVDIIAVKDGVELPFGKEALPELIGLPEGRSSVMIKAVAPKGTKNATYTMTVLARKVK
jgi:hypothetical protein